MEGYGEAVAGLELKTAIRRTICPGAMRWAFQQYDD